MGYSSDVCHEKPSLTSGLIRHQLSLDSIKAKYDMSNSTALGSGSYGTVSTVRHRETGELFAMKVVKAHTGESMESLRNEINVMKSLDHPNICKVLESFEDTRKGKFYIIMELCTGGMLVSRLKHHRFDEAQAATLIEKVLSAVLYCHNHGICHRDIKLDNLLYEDESEDAELKLIDFGFASSVRPGDETMHDQLGTPSYMAPELWAGSDRSYDSSVDMWALGATAYMLISGTRPFHNEDKRLKGLMIRYDPLRFPSKQWANVSPEAKDFCEALMQKQPRDRISASEAIRHPWITGRSRAHQEGPEVALISHEDVVKSLEDYADAEELKQLALEVIAFSTPPKKLEDLRHIFQTIDIDDSGTIDFGEWMEAMTPVSELPSPKLEQIFNVIDANNSGEIDYTEFLAATVSSHGPSVVHNSLRAAFHKLDDDADGLISRSDLDGALGGLLSPTVLDAVMKCADSSNGCVSYRAFKRCVVGAHLMSPM